MLLSLATLASAAVVTPRIVIAQPLIDLLRGAAAPPPYAVDPADLYIGDFISSGRFGAVCWAQLHDLPCVVKRASIGVEYMTEPPTLEELKQRTKRSAEYLETEAEVLRLLGERAVQRSSVALHEAYVAPFLGSCVKDSCRYLVWRASGEETLDDFLVGGGERLPELAAALGCAESDLARTVLHNVLRGLTHVHACGIAHRDIKPANLLVDPRAQKLRLIDFGSAADCGGWVDTERRGLRADRIPNSELFTPTSKEGRPSAFDDRAGWYKYDVYAAALVWLCVAVPDLAKDYGNLYSLRTALEASEHDVEEWRKTCTEDEGGAWEECAVPASDAFEAVFGWRAARQYAARPLHVFRRLTKSHRPTTPRPPGTRRAALKEASRWTKASGESKSGESAIDERMLGERQLAWQLLTRLLEPDSGKRPSATEALLGRYLNTDCSEGELPEAAPEPWTVEALLGASGMRLPRWVSADDECAIRP